MKRILPILIFLLFTSINLQAQGIFDSSIHKAIGHGDVSSPVAESPQQIIDQEPMTKFLDFIASDAVTLENRSAIQLDEVIIYDQLGKMIESKSLNLGTGQQVFGYGSFGFGNLLVKNKRARWIYNQENNEMVIRNA